MKLKVYECIIDDGKEVYKEVLTAKNKKQLLDIWGGNGSFEKITEVTNQYPLSLDSIMQAVIDKGFGIAEQRLLIEILRNYDNVIDDFH